MYETNYDEICSGNVKSKQLYKLFEIFGVVNLLSSELWHIWIKVS